MIILRFRVRDAPQKGEVKSLVVVKCFRCYANFIVVITFSAFNCVPLKNLRRTFYSIRGENFKIRFIRRRFSLPIRFVGNVLNDWAWCSWCRTIFNSERSEWMWKWKSRAFHTAEAALATTTALRDGFVCAVGCAHGAESLSFEDLFTLTDELFWIALVNVNEIFIFSCFLLTTLNPTVLLSLTPK